MTGMLASVSNLEEAAVAMAEGVDIIDLKQPAAGALGALDVDLVGRIVTMINGQCPVSATIGDLPTQPEPIFNAVKAMAATGVDYIKIGFFPGGDWQETVTKLAALTQQNIALISVLFADVPFDFNFMDEIKNAGFAGVMLDTINKSNGSLTRIMAQNDIAAFVSQAKSRQLLCGLAGSLRLEDIPGLLIYRPDYLGFRGALCLQHDRTATLSRDAVSRVRQAVKTDIRNRMLNNEVLLH